jgi:hypothetical protein
MNDEIDPSRLMSMMGLDDLNNMLEDEAGLFDKRKEPARALVLLEAVLESREMVGRVLERALVQLMTDGQELTVDGTGLYTGGAIRILRHEDHLHIESGEEETPQPAASMAGTYAEKVAELQKQIYSAQYYVELYQAALRNNAMTGIDVEKQTYEPEVLVEMLNDFWFSLPDTPAIRTGPFFLLCDLCAEEM